MKQRTTDALTESQISTGMKLVTGDGLVTEAMIVFTSGTFLVAMALHMGATNFQLGVLAAIPTFNSVFQLFTIWLVQKLKNRRLITGWANLLARLPFLAIGALPFIFSTATGVEVLICMIAVDAIFGAIAGAAWNAWMKDLIPGSKLGEFYSRRSRLSQVVNLTLSLMMALFIDYVKKHYPAQEINTYHIMFLVGGLFGMISVALLFRTPEPEAHPINGKLFQLIGNPFKNKNFKNLLVFNSFWSFALNLATPFFTVFMIKSLGLSVSYIIGLGIAGQLSSIASIKLWGRYSDRFSNKTIIRICAPLYIAGIIAFAFASMPMSHNTLLGLLLAIHIVNGVATAGINLAISNIGIKLAPNNEAIVYLVAKNMCVAFFSTLGPLTAGALADYFASHQLSWNIDMQSAHGITQLHLLYLKGWNYLFVIGGILALFSLRLLNRIEEEGETDRDRVVIYMRASLRSKMRNNLGREVADGIYYPSTAVRKKMNRLFRNRPAAYKKAA